MLVMKDMIHENGLWDKKGVKILKTLKKSISFLTFYVSNILTDWTFM